MRTVEGCRLDSLNIQHAGSGSFTLACYARSTRFGLPNPPTGRLGIFHAGLQKPAIPDSVYQIPQPAGWGSFTLAYKSPLSQIRFIKSPNRQVGDLSRWPTKARYPRFGLSNPPTAGWGSFELAY